MDQLYIFGGLGADDELAELSDMWRMSHGMPQCVSCGSDADSGYTAPVGLAQLGLATWEYLGGTFQLYGRGAFTAPASIAREFLPPIGRRCGRLQVEDSPPVVTCRSTSQR